jgi:branched-chain amino acid transport system ATP-binding protein
MCWPAGRIRRASACGRTSCAPPAWRGKSGPSSALENQPARTLSGGQRKLLELARILMADPQAILLDEPAAGVNPSLLELIIGRILDLNRAGTSILLIEHNMDAVARLCSRVVVMAAGRHLAAGSPAEITRDPAVVDAYLGGAPA